MLLNPPGNFNCVSDVRETGVAHFVLIWTFDGLHNEAIWYEYHCVSWQYYDAIYYDSFFVWIEKCITYF